MLLPTWTWSLTSNRRLLPCRHCNPCVHSWSVTCRAPILRDPGLPRKNENSCGARNVVSDKKRGCDSSPGADTPLSVGLASVVAGSNTPCLPLYDFYWLLDRYPDNFYHTTLPHTNHFEIREQSGDRHHGCCRFQQMEKQTQDSNHVYRQADYAPPLRLTHIHFIPTARVLASRTIIAAYAWPLPLWAGIAAWTKLNQTM